MRFFWSVCAAWCFNCVSHFTGQLVIFGRVYMLFHQIGLNVVTEPSVITRFTLSKMFDSHSLS